MNRRSATTGSVSKHGISRDLVDLWLKSSILRAWLQVRRVMMFNNNLWDLTVSEAV